MNRKELDSLEKQELQAENRMSNNNWAEYRQRDGIVRCVRCPNRTTSIIGQGVVHPATTGAEDPFEQYTTNNELLSLVKHDSVSV